MAASGAVGHRGRAEHLALARDTGAAGGAARWRDRPSRGLVGHAAVAAWRDGQPRGPWIELLAVAIDEHHAETGGADTPLVHFEEWLARVRTRCAPPAARAAADRPPGQGVGELEEVISMTRLVIPVTSRGSLTQGPGVRSRGRPRRRVEPCRRWRRRGRAAAAALRGHDRCAPHAGARLIRGRRLRAKRAASRACRPVPGDARPAAAVGRTRTSLSAPRSGAIRPRVHRTPATRPPGASRHRLPRARRHAHRAGDG